VVEVGRYFDGDVDEISVIICSQRTRRRLAGELPRCYTFGWRHVNQHELTMPIKMPPKYGQEKELPSYWKERTVRPEERLTWEGDQDEDGSETTRPINYMDKPDYWTAGNYVSYGTGSTSAIEKVLVCPLSQSLYLGLG
jgi:hypothetical protein